MDDSGAALQVTEETFQRDVLDRSFESPVVVDFWAEWCAPCRALGPVLEKLASEAAGRWTLAKVDVDSNQRLAAGFRIQGIPAVKAFRNGRQVAEFTGALPEAQVRQWLAQLGPTEAELLGAAARDAELRDEPDVALEMFGKVLELEPANAEARAAVARLSLAQRSQAADVQPLRDRLQLDPADVDAAIALGDELASRGSHAEAFDVLLDSVRTSTGDERDRARQHLLSLLDLLPADDPRVLAARKALALALY